MQNIFNNKPVQLAQGEVVALRIKGRVKLKVMTGRVWVTLQGDSADYWLCGGQQIDIPGYGILVIEAACGSSQVVMELPRQCAGAHLVLSDIACASAASIGPTCMPPYLLCAPYASQPSCT